MDFKISGEFRWNSYDVTTTEGFLIQIKIETDPRPTLEQHTQIRKNMCESLGLTAWAIPTAWGDNPIDYQEFNLVAENNLPLCKRLLEILKEGRREGFIDRDKLTNNGYLYPPDEKGDHPLFSKIEGAEKMLPEIKDFEMFKNKIKNIIDEACQPKVNLRRNNSKPTFKLR